MSRLIEWLELNESINDKGIWKACFMGGSPASGKSFVLKKIKSGSIDPRVVNTDTWVEFFGNGGNVDWDKYGDKTKQLTKSQLVNYLNSLLPLWIDGTSSNPSSLFRRQGILKSLGYDTAMVWVDTPLEDAIERNRKRDRNVDVDFIKKVYEKAQSLKPYYASEFGGNFTEILNGEGELNDKVIVNAYKKMDGWFNSPLQNPIGIELKREMIENGWKYLVDHPDYDMKFLKKLVDNWYK